MNFNMAIYSRNETYVHRTTLRDRNNRLVDTDWKLITIYDPCSNALISNGSMTRESKGEYYYNYSIESTATYGRYTSTVSFSNTGGAVGMDNDEFYVLPWDAAKNTRQISGISSSKSIEDKDLEDIIWMSYKEALKEVHSHHYNDTPQGNPDTGATFDGSNTGFQTRHHPIADSDGDGDVLGYGQSSCGTDITLWWKNSAGRRQLGKVTVTDSVNGEITLTQTTGAAIPSTQEGVYLDYYSEHGSFNEYIFQQAVSYLAAHYVEQRLKQADRVTMADLNRNQMIMVKNENRFFYTYKRLLGLVRQPMIGGV